MSGENGKFHIRIEGYPETDELIKRLIHQSETRGIKITTAARMFLKLGLDAFDRDTAALAAKRAKAKP